MPMKPPDPLAGLSASMQRATETMHKRHNPAGHMLGRLQTLIANFQSKMSEESEIGVTVVGGGSDGSFHLRQIRASDPDMLISAALMKEGATSSYCSITAKCP
ncbi:hypothetical protein IVB14_05205 [Bradyrhizobium sp. 180]|nr:hypothetical protein [Bradyrhizobium sp. 180]